MNEHRPIIREQIIFLALLTLVLLIVVYPPIYHGSIYATGGDDTAHHIAALTKLTDDISYLGNLRYYGYVLLLPFTYFGLSPITVVNVFNFLVIPAVFVSFWILVRRYYGLSSAALSFYISLFIVLGTWFYFNDGAIFNIFNLLVVGILGIYSLCRWLESGHYRWLLTSGLLFIASSLIHNVTYLYIMAAILLFVVSFTIYKYIQKDSIFLYRTLIFGAVFILSILTAWVSWMHKFIPEYSSAVIGTITEGDPPLAEPVSLAFFVDHDLKIGTVLLLSLTVLILVILLRKGSAEDKNSIVNLLNQPLSFVLLSFTTILAVGTFTLFGHNSERFARDLATFIGLETAIVLGLVLTYYRLKFKKLILIVVAVLLVTTNNASYYWVGDYTAVRSCDRDAIDLLNHLPNRDTEIQVSSAIVTWIVEVYTNDNIHLDWVSNWDNYKEADYLLYRNTPMTGDPFREILNDPLSPDNFDAVDPESLMKVAEFQTDFILVILYRVLE